MGPTVRKVRYGMVGGGEGAFIGPVHRTAAQIAGNWELVAGAFSSNAARLPIPIQGTLWDGRGIFPPQFVTDSSQHNTLIFREVDGWLRLLGRSNFRLEAGNKLY